MSNARLQQANTLILATLAAGWALYWLGQEGQRVQACWAGLALLPHAPFLALEMIWAGLLARQSSARLEKGGLPSAVEPLPGWRQWVYAWARETAEGIRVFGWQQPWAHRWQADHLPREGRRGVLLVHGYLCNRGFWNPWMRRLRAAGIPFVAVSLGPPRAGLDEQMQGLDAAWQRLKTSTGVTPLMVGHSMGGLLIRRWLSKQPEAFALQQEVITLGSPHHGTALASLGMSEAARQMRLQSPLLQELMRCETESRLQRFTCYWSVCDNVVFPASHATLLGARNVHVPARAHIELRRAPLVLDDVWARLGLQGDPDSCAQRI